DMAHSPKDWTLAFMVVARGPARQAAGLRLWSALEALLDRSGDVEQSSILAVATDQHQADGEPILPWHRQRDRAKIEEIDRIGVAQKQCILAAKFVGLRDR